MKCRTIVNKENVVKIMNDCEKCHHSENHRHKNLSN